MKFLAVILLSTLFIISRADFLGDLFKDAYAEDCKKAIYVLNGSSLTKCYNGLDCESFSNDAFCCPGIRNIGNCKFIPHFDRQHYDDCDDYTKVYEAKNSKGKDVIVGCTKDSDCAGIPRPSMCCNGCPRGCPNSYKCYVKRG